MIHVICAVRDRAADAFMRPFAIPSAAMAVRTFRDEVNRADQSNEMYRHPEDYDLYEIGSFDDSSGVITSVPARVLVRAQDIAEKR